MKITPLTETNINFVLDHIDEIHQKEIDVFGKTVEEVKKEFISMIGQPFAVAFYDDKLVCCAVFAMVRAASRWRIHLMMTKDCMKKIRFSLTQFFKNFSDHLAMQGEELETFTAFDSGKTYDWFKSMGFAYVGTNEQQISHYLKAR